MIKEAIDRILELNRPEKMECDGREYLRAGWVPMVDPQPECIATVPTLYGFLSYLSGPERNMYIPDHVQIVVNGFDSVSLVSIPDETWCNRATLIKAKFAAREFPFGHNMDIDDFVIQAQCRFVDTESKKAMIKHVSSISGSDVTTWDDDGISQTVATKQGIDRKKDAMISPMLYLQPYRTFPEVTQPESLFLLRMTHQEKAPPLVALHEADGGMWVQRACSVIAAYLRDSDIVKELGIKVIG